MLVAWTIIFLPFTGPEVKVNSKHAQHVPFVLPLGELKAAKP
jgi:hypothetical protein